MALLKPFAIGLPISGVVVQEGQAWAIDFGLSKFFSVGEQKYSDKSIQQQATDLRQSYQIKLEGLKELLTGEKNVLHKLETPEARRKDELEIKQVEGAISEFDTILKWASSPDRGSFGPSKGELAAYIRKRLDIADQGINLQDDGVVYHSLEMSQDPEVRFRNDYQNSSYERLGDAEADRAFILPDKPK